MAEFEPGHPKLGGRIAGTPNKRTLVKLLEKRCPGFHPIVAMWELYNNKRTPADVKARLLDSIASYTVPRLKPIDMIELLRLNDEAIVALAKQDDPVDTFIGAFLGGKLSAQDLATLIAALSLKQKAQGAVVDEQAELLKLIKSR